MGESSLINLSSLMALRRQLEVVANNVANTGTTGFRAQQLSFHEYLSPVKNQEVGVRSERALSSVAAAFAFTSPTAGALQTTQNPLDLALSGSGYFAVQTPEGERFTRDGSFSLDQTGRLVTADGFPVLTENGVVSVPSNGGEIAIDGEGLVSTKQGGLGRLRLVQFAESTILQAVGRNLFKANAPSTASPAASTKVLQGTLERSNVQPVLEMARLVEITRSYEVASKLLKDSLNSDNLNKLADVP